MTPLERTLHSNEQLCFIHIPKTAGTTLIALLDAHFPLDQICPAQLWRDLAWLPSEQLPRYSLLRGHYTYEDYLQLVPRPVFISMFRNPIDRACSYYNFMRNQPDGWLERHQGYRAALVASHPQVAALVEGDMEIYQRANQDDLPAFFASPFVQHWIQNWQVRSLSRSSFDTSPWDHETLLARAKARIETLAWFGLVERFSESMALLTYTFGWTPIRRYQRLMVAPNPDYPEGLPRKTLDILQEIHQLDQQLYTTAIALFETRYASMVQQLAQRYADPAIALSVSQSPSETLFNQLERRYRERAFRATPPPDEGINLTFEQAIAGTGWHLRETHGDNHGDSQRIFRWTGPETQSTLDLPLPASQSLTLKLRIVGAIADGLVDTLQINVGTESVPLIKLCHEVREGVYLALLEGIIPANAVDPDAPFTRLTLTVDQTQSLHSLNPANPDRRPVGLAVDWISIFPKAEPGEPGYHYMLFPGADFPWVTLAQWLRAQVGSSDRVIAPFEFVEVLPQRVVPYGAIAPAPDINWVVIHKGMGDQLPLMLLQDVDAQWNPVYADAVFVVYSRHCQVGAIAPGNEHLASFRANLATLLNPPPQTEPVDPDLAQS